MRSKNLLYMLLGYSFISISISIILVTFDMNIKYEFYSKHFFCLDCYVIYLPTLHQNSQTSLDLVVQKVPLTLQDSSIFRLEMLD